ncbi:histidine phosphatase family protein [Hydrogenophaga sp. BPS33]|uniref:histidine phosphatase family protein n=1 Tax=Hydrogenophaga sp. BPS33 TaxID=2651974 RepID=UPI0013203D19|nr:histidine phosphatase family protein [Hydrogenophaga sp. BPS33]QHE87434.1 histidine phosphatase family protein [Hydrogenophaga sp. BPS33]
MMRRRIVLMRHGAVDYFKPDGTPVESHGVPLNAQGRLQADAAGALFAKEGVVFDRVVVSGLPRTEETAQRVLAAAQQSHLALEVAPALAEIRGGSLAALLDDQLRAAFTHPFTVTRDVEAQRFLGGESVGEMLDRVLPAFDALLAREGWDCMLLVLHGGVNRALLSRALAGGRAFFGRLEQSPACINIVDVGTQDMIVRATNLAPTQWVYADERHTSMERLFAQYARTREPA